VSLESRVHQLEHQLGLLRREVALSPQRVGSTMERRRGWWLAVLNGSLAHGSTATAEIVTWDGSAWQRSGETITVQDYFLNTSDTAASGTLLKVEYYDNVWVPTAIYCAANDWSL